jgi:hypothetical protein
VVTSRPGSSQYSSSMNFEMHSETFGRFEILSAYRKYATRASGNAITNPSRPSLAQRALCSDVRAAVRKSDSPVLCPMSILDPAAHPDGGRYAHRENRIRAASQIASVVNECD